MTRHADRLDERGGDHELRRPDLGLVDRDGLAYEVRRQAVALLLTMPHTDRMAVLGDVLQTVSYDDLLPLLCGVVRQRSGGPLTTSTGIHKGEPGMRPGMHYIGGEGGSSGGGFGGDGSSGG